MSKHLANLVVQKRMRRVNRSRIGLITIGLIGTGLAFIWPLVTGGMVLVVRVVGCFYGQSFTLERWKICKGKLLIEY